MKHVGESKPCNCCQSNTCIWYQCQPCQNCFPFRYDVGGLCNGILAGVVSITAGCSNITNLSAIGVAVARLVHSFFCFLVFLFVQTDLYHQRVKNNVFAHMWVHIDGHSSNLNSSIVIQEIFGPCQIARCGLYQNRTDHLDFIVASYYGGRDAMTHLYFHIFPHPFLRNHRDPWSQHA